LKEWATGAPPNRKPFNILYISLKPKSVTMKLLHLSILILFMGIGYEGMGQSDKEPNQQSVETLKDAEDLYDIVPENELDGKVVSFEITYKSAESPGKMFIYNNHGAHFDGKLQKIINNAQPNDQIWIDDIKIVKETTRSYAFEVK
jgi:hypothetical protein